VNSLLLTGLVLRLRRGRDWFLPLDSNIKGRPQLPKGTLYAYPNHIQVHQDARSLHPETNPGTAVTAVTVLALLGEMIAPIPMLQTRIVADLPTFRVPLQCLPPPLAAPLLQFIQVAWAFYLLNAPFAQLQPKPGLLHTSHPLGPLHVNHVAKIVIFDNLTGQ
jgi:hypothetical protein